MSDPATAPLLEVRDLEMAFGTVKAVRGVSFSIKRGRTLALVGESGCGKTTTGSCIMRAYRPTAGSIVYKPTEGAEVDLATLPQKALFPYRREFRMIFQDPFASLNPRMTVYDNIAEPLKIHRIGTTAEKRERVASLLTKVGLRQEHMQRYPHAFSGGQRQRIVIARALALEPKVVVADEAVSALDVSIQAQVLNLLRELKRELGLTFLFISHALNVVEYMADDVAVMYLGKIVESGPAHDVFRYPRHPYTEALLSAIPVLDPRRASRRIILGGEVPGIRNPPGGCAFHPRCRYAQPICSAQEPELVPTGAAGRVSACHFATALSLQGADVEPREASATTTQSLA